MASMITAASPSPAPSMASTGDLKHKSGDAMDIDDDDYDGQSDIAVDDLPASSSASRPSASLSAAPSPLDPTAPTTATASSSSLASPSSLDEPAATTTYIPSAVLPTLARYVGRLLDVRVAARYLSTRSKEVVTRQVWGGADGHYTDDSDAVCMIVQSGLHIVRANPPADVSGNGGVVLTVRVGEAREQYVGVERYGLKSRNWLSRYHRLSLQVVSCDVTDNINATRSKGSSGPAAAAAVRAVSTAAVSTAPVPAASASASGAAASSTASATSAAGAKKPDKKELRQLKMVVVDRPAGGGSGGGGGYGRPRASRRKHIPECSVSFGEDETAWLHYSLWAVSDRAVDESSWCSARLRGEVLRLEGRDGRFELKREAKKGEKKGSVAAAAAAAAAASTSGALHHAAASVPFAAILAMKPSAGEFDTYSWAAARKEAAVVPSGGGGGGGRRNGVGGGGGGGNAGLDVVGGLDWSELEWSPEGVRVRGKEFRVDRLRWEKA